MNEPGLSAAIRSMPRPRSGQTCRGDDVVACNARSLDLLNDRQHIGRKLPRIRPYGGYAQFRGLGKLRIAKLSHQERERELARARAARWRAKHPGASAKLVAASGVCGLWKERTAFRSIDVQSRSLSRALFLSRRAQLFTGGHQFAFELGAVPRRARCGRHFVLRPELPRPRQCEQEPIAGPFG